MEELLRKQHSFRFGSKDGFFYTGKDIGQTISLGIPINALSEATVFTFMPLFDGKLNTLSLNVFLGTSGNPSSNKVIGELQDQNGNVLLSRTLDSGRMAFSATELSRNNKYKIVVKNNHESNVYTARQISIEGSIYEKFNNYIIVG